MTPLTSIQVAFSGWVGGQVASSFEPGILQRAGGRYHFSPTIRYHSAGGYFETGRVGGQRIFRSLRTGISCCGREGGQRTYPSLLDQVYTSVVGSMISGRVGGPLATARIIYQVHSGWVGGQCLLHRRFPSNQAYSGWVCNGRAGGHIILSSSLRTTENLIGGMGIDPCRPLIQSENQWITGLEAFDTCPAPIFPNPAAVGASNHPFGSLSWDPVGVGRSAVELVDDVWKFELRSGWWLVARKLDVMCMDSGPVYSRPRTLLTCVNGAIRRDYDGLLRAAFPRVLEYLGVGKRNFIGGFEPISSEKATFGGKHMRIPSRTCGVAVELLGVMVFKR
ncbi:uncharacterized protein EI97DRAFT_443574 [Westerdykella ornata]|uniref:Uncharacterized protein n=1 Tax=Westerdykella ornata TaxID=318751 RepID=A0A6A6JF13_WESOR|nr:uncharacterized protein EI97DRAFT_443574 [Westerdykella ornata]KAF2275002.1 hypothetical protein EI97DRAFT_443574 [Westerdykella ornata]